ncbi:unnamed protein product [Ceratitis capitata]|uniref:(Mediterranean fruit fly) hypothetical protein n=1 Tax=Ceratitis capitata TaxID=7213 RepID=A0A811VI90_CERCA|nr:unnamed protein product [Ceratitis capitata]
MSWTCRLLYLTSVTTLVAAFRDFWEVYTDLKPYLDYHLCPVLSSYQISLLPVTTVSSISAEPTTRGCRLCGVSAGKRVKNHAYIERQTFGNTQPEPSIAVQLSRSHNTEVRSKHAITAIYFCKAEIGTCCDHLNPFILHGLYSVFFWLELTAKRSMN